MIKTLLVDPNTIVLIACGIDDPSDIYGYLVGEIRDGVPILHWMYVRQDFRRFGIAHQMTQQLFDAAPIQKWIVVTHLGRNYCYVDKHGDVYLKKSKREQNFIFKSKWAFIGAE